MKKDYYYIIGIIYWIAIIILIVVSIKGCYGNNKKENDNITEQEEIIIEKQGIYKVYIKSKKLHNNSVGSDWVYTYESNGNKIKSGDIVNGDEITIDITITEMDSVPDRSTATITIPIFDGSIESKTITVRENRGRYAGNTASFEITIEIIEY